MSTDRQSPLDADERELARVLRALPAGEPPSALDARILAMARDAVVSTPALSDEARPSRRRAPRLAWGLGVAASCVMAAGLVWRMGGFGGESLDVVGSAVPEESAAPAAAAEPVRQPAAPMPEAESESISVEIGSAPSAPAPQILPPPPPPPAAEAPARQRAATASMENLAEQRREAQADASDAAFAPEPPPPPAPMAEAAEASTAAAPPPAPAPAGAVPEERGLDRVTVFGSRFDPDLRRPVAEDGNAGAQAWIQRIRARIAAGDEEGARESLEAFVARHPGRPLPQDLIDFRARPPAQ